MAEHHALRRRRFGRRTVHQHGWVKQSGLPDMPCIVRDLSVKGARLELQRPMALPLHFVLSVPSTGFQTWVMLRHQTGPMAGLEFISGDPKAATASAQGQHVCGHRVAMRMRGSLRMSRGLGLKNMASAIMGY